MIVSGVGETKRAISLMGLDVKDGASVTGMCDVTDDSGLQLPAVRVLAAHAST